MNKLMKLLPVFTVILAILAYIAGTVFPFLEYFKNDTPITILINNEITRESLKENQKTYEIIKNNHNSILNLKFMINIDNEHEIYLDNFGKKCQNILDTSIDNRREPIKGTEKTTLNGILVKTTSKYKTYEKDLDIFLSLPSDYTAKSKNCNLDSPINLIGGLFGVAIRVNKLSNYTRNHYGMRHEEIIIQDYFKINKETDMFPGEQYILIATEKPN